MAPDPSLPRIDRCTELYLDVWDLFGERSFEPDEVARRLIEHERDVAALTGSDEPRRGLDLLVAYGLLERDDERYRVRCRPNENVEDWHRDVRPQLEAVHRRVGRLQRRRRDGPDSENEPGEGPVVRREGDTYVAIDVEEDAPFLEIAANVTESATRQPDTAGVALCAPADLAGAVQQLADRLCSADAMAEVGRPRFEKVTSDVVGEHKDDLEYRLYLRRV